MTNLNLLKLTQVLFAKKNLHPIRWVNGLMATIVMWCNAFVLFANRDFLAFLYLFKKVGKESYTYKKTFFSHFLLKNCSKKLSIDAFVKAYVKYIHFFSFYSFTKHTQKKILWSFEFILLYFIVFFPFLLFRN